MADDIDRKPTCWVVLTTCPDADSADRLAEMVVARNLAACVNIQPQVRSIYRWQGNVERAAEHLLLIKTTAARYDELECLIRANHPYELPEVIAVPIVAGSSDYLGWIHTTVCESP